MFNFFGFWNCFQLKMGRLRWTGVSPKSIIKIILVILLKTAAMLYLQVIFLRSGNIVPKLFFSIYSHSTQFLQIQWSIKGTCVHMFQNIYLHYLKIDVRGLPWTVTSEIELFSLYQTLRLRLFAMTHELLVIN